MQRKYQFCTFCTLCNPFLFLKFVAIPEIWCLRPHIICSSFRLTWLSLIGGGSAELSKCGEDHLFNYFFPIFHPELPFLATVSRPDNESCEIVKKQREWNPGEVLAKPIQKESGGKKWVCFHIGTLYMSGCGAATAKRHVPTLLHLSPSVSLEYIYAICQSASTSVPQFHSSTVPQCSAFILSAAFSLYGK